MPMKTPENMFQMFDMGILWEGQTGSVYSSKGPQITSSMLERSTLPLKVAGYLVQRAT